jgi:hypothetical protein
MIVHHDHYYYHWTSEEGHNVFHEVVGRRPFVAVGQGGSDGGGSTNREMW